MGLLANTKEGGATLCIMSPSCAENANVSKMLLRNGSSLSTHSSDFEFDVSEEFPLSPKPLCSPAHYTPNHFPDWESFLMPSTNYPYSAERNTASVVSQDGSISSSSSTSSEIDGTAQIKGALNDYKQGLKGKFEHISVGGHTGNDNYETSASDLMANHAVNGGKRGTTLRSLLNRRDLMQLPPLTNYRINQIEKVNMSASAASPSSSPPNYCANHSSNTCKFEECRPDEAGRASPPDSKGGQKKSRKWAFKLDFLKKSSSPRVDQALAYQASSNNHADYSLNHGIKPNQNTHCSRNAAAEKVGSGDYSHEREHDAAEEAVDLVNQRSIDHYRAAGAASEARFNRLINESINVNCRAAANRATKERRINQQINQSIDYYRVAAAAAITKYELPRHSTCSVISSVSSSPRRSAEMIRANHRKISRSAPTSPAGSPPHGASEQDAFTQGRPPMSPHALHYKQQKARADELRRKTFLPYRQSLLGSCFFPLSTHSHYPHQPVY